MDAALQQKITCLRNTRVSIRASFRPTSAVRQHGKYRFKCRLGRKAGQLAKLRTRRLGRRLYIGDMNLGTPDAGTVPALAQIHAKWN